MLSKDDLLSVNRMTLLLLDALLDETLWESTLKKFSEYFNGSGAQAVFVRPSDGNIFGAYTYGVKEKDLISFLEFDDHINGDPRFKASLANPNRPQYCRMFVSDDELHNSPIYREVLQPASIEYTLAAPVNLEKQDFVMNFVIFRGPEQPGFSPKDAEILLALMPHFRRVAEVYLKFKEKESNTEELRAVLDEYYSGIMVLERDCSLVFANRSAQKYLDEHDGLGILNGKLCLSKQDQNNEFQHSIYRTAIEGAGAAGKAATAVRVERPSGREPLYLFVNQIAGNLPRLQSMMFNRSLVVVCITDITRVIETQPERLQYLFGLTESEAEILVQISQGNSVAEIAQSSGRSKPTIRNHLSNIMEKTNTHSQRELVRLVLSSEPVIGT